MSELVSTWSGVDSCEGAHGKCSDFARSALRSWRQLDTGHMYAWLGGGSRQLQYSATAANTRITPIIKALEYVKDNKPVQPKNYK